MIVGGGRMLGLLESFLSQIVCCIGMEWIWNPAQRNVFQFGL